MLLDQRFTAVNAELVEALALPPVLIQVAILVDDRIDLLPAVRTVPHGRIGAT